MKSKLDAIQKKLKKSKTVLETKDVKRIVFPWLRNRVACKAKAYMAYLADSKHHSFRKTGKMKPFFLKFIVPSVVRKFPNLYGIVAKHYHKKGKPLSNDHYILLLYARFTNMYNKDLSKDGEHPINSGNENLRNHYTAYVIRSNQRTELRSQKATDTHR